MTSTVRPSVACAPTGRNRGNDAAWRRRPAAQGKDRGAAATSLDAASRGWPSRQAPPAPRPAAYEAGTWFRAARSVWRGGICRGRPRPQARPDQHGLAASRVARPHLGGRGRATRPRSGSRRADRGLRARRRGSARGIRRRVEPRRRRARPRSRPPRASGVHRPPPWP